MVVQSKSRFGNKDVSPLVLKRLLDENKAYIEITADNGKQTINYYFRKWER